MAMHHKEQPNKFLNGLQNVSKGIGTIKGLYDMGRGLYSAYRVAAPIIQSAAMALL